MDDAAVADPTPVVEQQGPQNKNKKPRKKKNKQQNADTVPDGPEGEVLQDVRAPEPQPLAPRAPSEEEVLARRAACTVKAVVDLWLREAHLRKLFSLCGEVVSIQSQCTGSTARLVLIEFSERRGALAALGMSGIVGNTTLRTIPSVPAPAALSRKRSRSPSGPADEGAASEQGASKRKKSKKKKRRKKRKVDEEAATTETEVKLEEKEKVEEEEVTMEEVKVKVDKKKADEELGSDQPPRQGDADKASSNSAMEVSGGDGDGDGKHEESADGAAAATQPIGNNNNNANNADTGSMKTDDGQPIITSSKKRRRRSRGGVAA